MGERAKPYLKQIYFLNRDIERLNTEINNIADIKAINYENERVQVSLASSSNLDNTVIKLDELKKEKKDKLSTLTFKIEEIGKQIEKVKNAELREILSLRYVCCLKFKDIADIMDFSVESIYKKHTKALKVLENIIKNERLQ